MGKYEPLNVYLRSQGRDYVPMTFAEIERVLGDKLPPSKMHRAWWSNNPTNNVMTKEWLDAGFETESVDIAGEKLAFRRVKRKEDEMGTAGFDEKPQAEFGAPVSKHPGFGFMKGLITIEEGYDLTSPSDEAWDDVYLCDDRLKGKGKAK